MYIVVYSLCYKNIVDVGPYKSPYLLNFMMIYSVYEGYCQNQTELGIFTICAFPIMHLDLSHVLSK